MTSTSLSETRGWPLYSRPREPDPPCYRPPGARLDEIHHLVRVNPLVAEGADVHEAKRQSARAANLHKAARDMNSLPHSGTAGCGRRATRAPAAGSAHGGAVAAKARLFQPADQDEERERAGESRRRRDGRRRDRGSATLSTCGGSRSAKGDVVVAKLLGLAARHAAHARATPAIGNTCARQHASRAALSGSRLVSELTRSLAPSASSVDVLSAPLSAWTDDAPPPIAPSSPRASRSGLACAGLDHSDLSERWRQDATPSSLPPRSPGRPAGILARHDGRLLRPSLENLCLDNLDVERRRHVAGGRPKLS